MVQRILVMLVGLLFLGQLSLQGGTIDAVFPSSFNININATYTWQITFDSTTPRSDLSLTFPTSCTLVDGSTSASIAGTPLTSTVSGNVLMITTTTTLLFSSVSIVVTLVQNPNSAITTNSFSASSSIDTTFSLLQSGSLIYQKGVLASCSWSFSACTQQPNSNLTITTVLTNPVLSGTNQLIIGYGRWVNHNTKDLAFGLGANSLITLVSTDGTNFATTSSTVINSGAQFITVQYSLSLGLGQGSTLTFIIQGVLSPPTQITTTTTNFYISTADSNGAKIDQTSIISIANTCIYTLSGGTFSTSTMLVNTNISSPQISFSQTPIISLQSGDTVQLYFTPLANFNNCPYLRIWRNINNPLQASLDSTNSFYQYSLPSNNIEYTYSLTLSPVCTNVLVPSSQTPTTLTFIFKRNTSPYMQLTAIMYPTATSITTSKLYSRLSTYEMTSSAVDYTFSIVTSQPLGSTPALKIGNMPFGATIGLTPTCVVTLVSGTVTAQTCIYNSTTFTLDVNFTATNTLASSTNITLVVSGITNPFSPTTHALTVSTYYDSTVTTSRVQKSGSTFGITYTGITAYPATFGPTSGVTVYTTTLTTITLTTNINIPGGSTIYVEYPTAVTQLVVGVNPLALNGSSVGVSGTNNNGNNSFSITTSSSITAGSTIVISTSVRSPSSMGSYSFVIITIKSGTTLYLQSATSMVMLVDTVNSLTATITPTDSTTGALSAYTLTLTISVPHPASFYVTVDLPTDVTFTSSGASCIDNCSSTVSSLSLTSFRLTATNTLSGSTGHILTFSLGSSFTNARAVNISSLWTITTSTITPTSTITVSRAAPTIVSPNILTTSFLADSYYAGNTRVVKMSFHFTNDLVTGDYILLLIPKTTYYQHTTVGCSAIYGVCARESILSSTDTLVIQITSNTSAITNKTLTLTLQGLISGNDTYNSITVQTQNSTGYLMDRGVLTYQVSCLATNTSFLFNCKTCNADGSCIDCYTIYGFYLNGTSCVSDCGLANSYRNYNSSSTGVCETCINNCFTCLSSTLCITCLNTYYYYTDQTCQSTCQSTGYVSQTINSILFCNQCYGNGSCVTCTSSSAGFCTLCDTIYVLSNGICSGSCANNSMYPSGGFCYNCDVSCSTCTIGGNAGCTTCAVNYFSYNGFCLSSCPSGTVVNSTGVCTCDLPCTTCTGSTNYCSTCNDSAMFVSGGQCLSSCPTSTYLSGSTCVDCNTACINCSTSTCFSCLSSYYLYNNLCYSDCNLISQQYDVSGSTCVLCPDGCDTCSQTVCTSCITDYTISSSSSQCIKTCLLTNSCENTGEQVLPLPGLISVAIWTVIVLVIKLVLQKNYIPYSLILFNTVVQFILVIAIIANARSITTTTIYRLLVASDSQRLTIRALLGTSLALNYLTNIAYIIIFVKYIKPLMINPRQIDVISNVVVLVLAGLTNYRFALIAFAKLFPKPYIHVANPSKLTPIHYLCISSLLLDIFPIVACAIALLNQPSKTTIFMLAIDLLLIITFNIIVTIWFVACAKPEEYYQDDIKKYHTQDHHHGTNQTMTNQKDASKMNIVANQTMNFTDDQVQSPIKVTHVGGDYKKLNSSLSKGNYANDTRARIGSQEFGSSGIDQSHIIPVRGKRPSDSSDQSHIIPVRGNKLSDNSYDPYSDPNYEVGLKPKNSGRYDITPTRDMGLGASIRSTGKNDQDVLGVRTKESPHNFSKKQLEQGIKADRDREIYVLDEGQGNLPDLPAESDVERKNVFDGPREKLARPKRAGGQKRTGRHKQGQKAQKKQSPMKVMQKSPKVGYFQSDALQSNEDDLEQIIKQKVWQSTIKKPKRNQESNMAQQSNTSQLANQQISPSWFNIQNQRIDLSDFGENIQQK